MPDGPGSQTKTVAANATSIALIALAALLVFMLRHVLLLVFGSILIAVGLRGLASVIERIAPIGKKWSLAAAAVIVLGVVAGIMVLGGAQITAQMGQLLQTLPDAWTSLRARLEDNALTAALITEIEFAMSSPNSSPLPAFASRVGAFTMSFAGAALELMLVVIAAGFIAVSPDTYRGGALALAPSRIRPHLRQAFNASATALRKWLIGTLVSMVFLSVVVSLGLWALGVPAPLALGLLAGLAQFVPLVGPILASAPAILLALTVGPETAAWTVLLYVLASQVEANLVFPMIQERAVSLPPALTLFGVIAFGLLLGPLGVLFATPLIVVVSVFVVIFYVRGALGDHTAPIPGQ
jgi:predicted PurR-regulated permease PerM